MYFGFEKKKQAWQWKFLIWNENSVISGLFWFSLHTILWNRVQWHSSWYKLVIFWEEREIQKPGVVSVYCSIWEFKVTPPCWGVQKNGDRNREFSLSMRSDNGLSDTLELLFDEITIMDIRFYSQWFQLDSLFRLPPLIIESHNEHLNFMSWIHKNDAGYKILVKLSLVLKQCISNLVDWEMRINWVHIYSEVEWSGWKDMASTGYG